MEKGILIIGGGELQIAGLAKAKELGFTTYLVDAQKNVCQKNMRIFFMRLILMT